jgi:hypothetical protein
VSEGAWVLLTALVVSVISPAVLGYLTNRANAASRLIEWKRQDEVAARVTGRLEQIHTLVNSNLTAALEAELAATVAQLSLMRAVPNMTTSDEIALETVSAKAGELRAALMERRKATDEAAAQRQAIVHEEGSPDEQPDQV